MCLNLVSERVIIRGSAGQFSEWQTSGITPGGNGHLISFILALRSRLAVVPFKGEIQHLRIFSVFHADRLSELCLHFICVLKAAFGLHSV